MIFSPASEIGHHHKVTNITVTNGKTIFKGARNEWEPWTLRDVRDGFFSQYGLPWVRVDGHLN